jgi:hypothetical protein
VPLAGEVTTAEAAATTDAGASTSSTTVCRPTGPVSITGPSSDEHAESEIRAIRRATPHELDVLAVFFTASS